MTRLGGVIAVPGGLAVFTGLALVLMGVSVLRAMFAGVNVATLLTYGYDKYVSRTSGRRVPEAVLHLLAAAGGTPGAFLGQMLFRHKTRDRWFRLIFLVIVTVQTLTLLTAAYLRNG
jgi:uncharacterized membrane protein YsdA (DUF1294 family)